ncbi:MAG: hypothetical protein HYU34_03845 [Candidatus Omnitrophica bacterium]|nr:hypothetical protein [Candidatus Omnitrophota bacterium]
MKLWHLGLLLTIGASLVNGLLIRFDITGLPREFMRLLILLGLGILAFSLIQKFKRN